MASTATSKIGLKWKCNVDKMQRITEENIH